VFSVVVELVLLAAAGAFAALAKWLSGDDEEPEENQKNVPQRDTTHPRVSVEKRRDYDEDTKTLTETVTTTKVFPDVDPRDLEEK
jgi:hypothetical protein